MVEGVRGCGRKKGRKRGRVHEPIAYPKRLCLELRGWKLPKSIYSRAEEDIKGSRQLACYGDHLAAEKGSV